MSDTIDRQDAIDAILDLTDFASVIELFEHVEEHDLQDKRSGGIIDAIDAVLLLPSAQPEQRWTPCSERLPEFDFMDVLVCFHDKRSGCEKDYYFISAYIVHGVWEPTLHVDLTDLEAVAWMPLPEPYNEDRK